MGGLSLTTINLIIRLIIIIWILTLTRSIAIMFCGKLFEKASKGSKTAIYPFLNLFGMLEVVELSTFWGILLFIPVTNLIVLFMMSLKLGEVFNVSTGKRIGLILLPIVFYPLLAKENVSYKTSNEEYLLALDSAKSESIHLLTQEEINEFNMIEEPVAEVVDSIFKSELEQIKEPEPYRAKRINETKTNNDMMSDNLFDSINEPNKFEMQQPQQEQKVETIELVNDIFKPVEKTNNINNANNNNDVVINSFGSVSQAEQQAYTPFVHVEQEPTLIIEDNKPNNTETNNLFRPIEDQNGFTTIGKIETNKFIIDEPVTETVASEPAEEFEIFEDLTPSTTTNQPVADVSSLFKPIEETNSFSNIEKINYQTDINKFVGNNNEEQNIFKPIEKVDNINQTGIIEEQTKKANKFVIDFDEPDEMEFIDL